MVFSSLVSWGVAHSFNCSPRLSDMRLADALVCYILYFNFLSRVSILTRIDIAILYVRLSVRYVPVFYGSSLTYRHSFFTTGSPVFLVL